jgi:hypothetical protein
MALLHHALHITHLHAARAACRHRTAHAGTALHRSPASVLRSGHERTMRTSWWWLHTADVRFLHAAWHRTPLPAATRAIPAAAATTQPYGGRTQATRGSSISVLYLRLCWSRVSWFCSFFALNAAFLRGARGCVVVTCKRSAAAIP